jgi:multicomponent Na+:H+ antiporter subunit E
MLYALLWWVLSGDAGAALLFGALAIAAAAAASWRLGAQAPGRLRWTRVPRFAALFVWQSLRGGTDIALRAFSPDMRLRPGLVVVRLTLADQGMRTLLALVVSLLPGTIAVRLEGFQLTLHALDRRWPVEAEVRRFEGELAALFATT